MTKYFEKNDLKRNKTEDAQHFPANPNSGNSHERETYEPNYETPSRVARRRSSSTNSEFCCSDTSDGVSGMIIVTPKTVTTTGDGSPRSRLSTQDSLTILATTSPEIQELCKHPNLVLEASYSLQQDERYLLELQDFDFENEAEEKKQDSASYLPYLHQSSQSFHRSWDSSSGLSFYDDENARAHEDQLPPWDDDNGMPLGEITTGITLSLRHLRLSPQRPPRDFSMRNKENIPPSLFPRSSHCKFDNPFDSYK